MDDPDLEERAAPVPLTFDEAVRNVVRGLEETVAEFERLREDVPDEAYTEGEWKAIEAAATEVELLAEQVQLDYAMAAYDSEAWYEVMKDLPKVTQRVGDALLLMREARARLAKGEPQA